MMVFTPEQKQKLLAKSSLFQNIDYKDLDNLAKYSKVKSAKAREVICRRGDTGSQMFIIARGRVTLHTDSDEGKELGFGFMREGDIFGEIALFDGGERTATVKAIEPTELLIIEKRDFLAFLEKTPKVAIQLLAAMAQRLRRTDEHFEDIFFRNLPGRLAKKFLGLAEVYGQETATGLQIDMKLSQGEIGKFTGATRESVNKQMRAWEAEGLINCNKGWITILEREKLEELTECD